MSAPLYEFRSPTGAVITGTYERTKCECFVLGLAEDGTPEHSGESDMHWDDTHPIEIDGKPLYLDACGDTWTFDELVRGEEVQP